jgi:methylase of polypeptide subunit release factors
MSQRNSGFERKPLDRYETPTWVTECLVPHVPADRVKTICDPCCGSGKILDVFRGPYKVVGYDLSWGKDFLEDDRDYDAIITNPPYNIAEDFVRHAIRHAGYVAMLLRTDYDHAFGRHDLFIHPKFSKQIKLWKRIVWEGMEINAKTGKKAAPSYSHTWFIWDSKHKGDATVAYAR